MGDPSNLKLTLDLNDIRMQDGSTKNMIFNADYLIYYISQFMTLEPGDLINTGTPKGVGMGEKPPRYLSEGDEVILAIEGLGEQRQICCRAK